MNYKVFTSESVASGHPDKICDQISDAILDEALSNDKYSRVAVETLVTTNHVVLAGEITTKTKLNYKKIAQDLIRSIGYTKKEFHFTPDSHIDVLIHEQSPEISQGVNTGGAGDQGMMFGFATNETEDLMPLPITLAHGLVKALDDVRVKKILPYLYPDGKSEVAVSYQNGKPKSIEQVVVAAPHQKGITNNQIKQDLFKKIVLPTLDKYDYKIPFDKFVVNGTGIWTTPGPASDTGVTGRKIIVDSYGGFARVGGGCFSGKDPTKVDRSAAYAARYIAKNIVAAKLTNKVEVQLAYVIGQREPISKAVETFGTEKTKIPSIEDFAWSLLDLSVEGIIKKFKLLRPIYLNTSVYGHFGKGDLPWEEVKFTQQKM